MSRPVDERLRELAEDVEQVRLAPAADVRARGLRRARRRRAGAAAAAAGLVLATGFGVTEVLRPGGGPGPLDPAATPPAGSASCAYPVSLALPEGPGSVVIQVFAGAGPASQADQVVQQLTERGFAASDTPGSDPAAGSGGTAAVLRYGPGAIGASSLVRALIGDDVVMAFDPRRAGSTVDVVLGAGFRRLATATEVNQALAQTGVPTRPPGC